MHPYYIIEHCIWDKNLDGYDIAVYNCLKHHLNNKTGLCYPSIRLMSKELKWCCERIIKSLNRLEALSLTERLRGKNGQSVKYSLTHRSATLNAPLSQTEHNNKNITRRINNRNLKILKKRFPDTFNKIYDKSSIQLS